MARLEIDDRAFSDPRLKKLARLLGIQQPQAFGILAFIWHDSQEQLKESATAEEISTWLETTPKRGQKIITALVDAGYLEPISDQNFKIKGNKNRLNFVEFRRKKARIAATARWTKQLHSLAKLQNEDAPSIVQAMPSEEERRRRVEVEKGRREECSNTVPNFLDDAASACEAPLFAADAATPHDPWGDWDHKAVPLQAVPVEDLQPKPKRASKAKADSSGANLVIAAYMDAYGTKFNGQKVDLVGPERGAAKRLAIDLGVERAVALVRAYLQMTDEWFIKQEYRLAILAQNVKKVGLFLDQGVAITPGMARSAGLEANNKAVCDRVIDRLQNQRTAAGAW